MLKILTKNSLSKYLFFSGVIAFISTVLLFFLGLKYVLGLGVPLPILAEKTKKNIELNYPSLSPVVLPLLAHIISLKKNIDYEFFIEPLDWQGVGANTNALGFVAKLTK